MMTTMLLLLLLPLIVSSTSPIPRRPQIRHDPIGEHDKDQDWQTT